MKENSRHLNISHTYTDNMKENRLSTIFMLATMESFETVEF